MEKQRKLYLILLREKVASLNSYTWHSAFTFTIISSCGIINPQSPVWKCLPDNLGEKNRQNENIVLVSVCVVGNMET